MASSANDDGDLSKHFVISKSISIEFKTARKTSERLEVVFNGDLVPTNFQNADGLTYGWTLDRDIHIFPNSNDLNSDTLTLRVGSKKKGFLKRLKARNDKLDEFKLASEEIADKFKHSSSIRFPGQNCTAIFNVTTGSIEDILATESSEELDPLLHVQSFIASGNSLLQNAEPLKSILENLPFSQEVLNEVEKTIGDLANAHPLAKAIFTALSIPYKLLKNEHEFKKNVQVLAEAMHFACRCLMDVRDHTKTTSATNIFVSMMRTLRDAALFVEVYRRKGRFRQVVAAQFPTKLENYTENLITQKNNFQMAMVLQIARDVDMMESTTSDDFLRKRLHPIEQQPLDDGCLKGTRVKILDETTDWLQDSTSKNILWIVGAPGAGKSTIATTIAKQLQATERSCSKFFSKRDDPHLRDPRQIWRTLAYGLADNHDGLKAILMLRLIEKKNRNPQDDTVFDQFQKLIGSMLQTIVKETRFRSHQILYPVVIIDALDECYSADDNSWQSLLDSLTCWTELPGVFKLVVTSRDHFDIRTTLGNASRQIDLSTGDNVSDDSTDDIRKFFTTRFAEIRKKYPGLPSDWPGEAAMEEMTYYAAGLFIWADMVVKYIGHRTVGRIPASRLEDVLSDIKPQSGNQRNKIKEFDGRDRVDRVYARIVFEAFRHSGAYEREAAKSVLAAVVLAKEPLRTCDLVDLLSTDTSNSSDVLASIESTLWELSPIIPISDDANHELRVCHKTVSDFFLSHDRSSAALKSIVKNWTLQTPDDSATTPDPHSFILNTEKDNRNLAIACLHLARRNFSLDIHSIAALLKESNRSLDYAHQHWLEHLESGGGSRVPNLKCFAGAMKLAYGCLQRYAPHMMLAKEDAVALIASLRDAAAFASQCIDEVSDERIVNLQQELEEYTKNLDIARGKFQIAMVLNLASDIDKSASDSTDIFLRKRLEPSSQTLLDDECLKGTRRSVLQQAKDWLGDSEKPNILWILGAPGAGKSAIATTLAKQFSDKRLCAKVVAKRDFADRRDPRSVWRTLVYNLAGLHVGLKGSIMEALSEKAHYSQDEFRDLIAEAVQDQQYLSVVVVIDALDECFIEDNEDWRDLLLTVARWADLPRTFKLVVTSRDIPDIHSALAEVSYPVSLTTGTEASIEAKSDTMLFFRANFAEMRGDFTDIPPDWPSDKAIQQLTDYAAGSFIWAKMVVELVGKLGPPAVDRLEDMLSGVELGSTELMDNLYAKMLFEIFAPLDGKERKVSRSILAAIVLAKDPLRKGDLVELLSLRDLSISVDDTSRSVESAVDQLSCVISVDEKHVLRIPHKSFSDLLLDHDRSSKAMSHFVPKDEARLSYLINREADSASMAIACLRLMNASLTFNICGINTSHCLNEDIPELDALISKNINTALIYACRFWAEHLRNIPRDDQLLRVVLPLLKSLLHKKFPHWLEVLSFVKAIPSVEASLTAAAYFLKEYDDDLAEVAKDARKFASTSEEPITAAATHIYISALPFCPSNSWMARIYGHQYPNLLSVTSGQRMYWDEAASTSDGHAGEVNSVAFFPDGRKLASGSDDKTVRVWDSKTGNAASAPLIEHTELVWSVAVSPDGKLIASGSKDKTLRIWDSDTGACPLGPISAHSNIINSVTFSPDGSRIVTGSDDCTLKVWNVATGDLCLGPLTGHTDEVWSVAFSHDGTSTCIASGSKDRTIRIWDASTGESRRGPLIGHISAVFCVAFSADGHYLASGAGDETIRLWDVTQGFTEITTVTLGSSVRSLSFSPTNNCLVSGFGDGTLCFWSISSGNLEQIGEAIDGHSGFVHSVAFSPDGCSVASGSYDKSIKIWTVPTTSTRPPVAADRVSENSVNEAISSFLDRRGSPVLSYTSYIDENGWMRDSQRKDSRRLFWVPRENRKFFLSPRNTTVIVAGIVTRVDFTRFAHGDDWAECRSELV